MEIIFYGPYGDRWSFLKMNTNVKKIKHAILKSGSDIISPLVYKYNALRNFVISFEKITVLPSL